MINILNYQKLVMKIACQWDSNGIPLEDLVQEGILGLLEAEQRFDETRGCKFSTYAVPWVKKYIRSYVRKHSSCITNVNQANQLLLGDEIDSISVQDHTESNCILADAMRHFSEKEQAFICARMVGETYGEIVDKKKVAPRKYLLRFLNRKITNKYRKINGL